MTVENMDNRPGWNSFYLAGVSWVAMRADCRRRKVGAILVDAGHKVLGIGYNGTDPGRPGCLEGACPRGLLSYRDVPANSDYGNCIARHAEENAIRNVPGGIRPGDPRLAGSTMYITDAPCPDCQVLLKEYGIRLIVY